MSSEDIKNTTASLHKKLQEEELLSKENNEEEKEKIPYETLAQKLATAEEKCEENWQLALRTKADMENVKKRLERDVTNAHKYAIESFVLELLPIMDGLERALEAHEKEATDDKTLLDGVKLTLKMFQAAFTKFGVESVNPVNEVFNPEHHQAVSSASNAEATKGVVLTVLQKGYLLNKRLIRPALVVVAK